MCSPAPPPFFAGNPLVVREGVTGATYNDGIGKASSCKHISNLGTGLFDLCTVRLAVTEKAIRRVGVTFSVRLSSATRSI